MGEPRSAAILCPACRRLIAADEPRCPFCGVARPGRADPLRALRVALSSDTPVTPLVLAACVLLYGASLLIEPGAWFGAGVFDILSPSFAALDALGMTSGARLADGAWWTILTYVFLHGSLIHVAFNLGFLAQVGPACERMFSRAYFLVLVFVTGALAGLASDVLDGTPTIGASGACFGLLGALVAAGQRRGAAGAFETRQAMTWAAMGFLFGFLVPQVNNLAHGAGFLAGYALGWVAPRRYDRPTTRALTTVASLLAALTLTGLVLSLRQAFG